MNFRLTARMRVLVDELNDLRDLVERRLGKASADARVEWSKLSARIPRLSLEESSGGFVAVSESELEEMKIKLTRCAQILDAPSAKVQVAIRLPESIRRATRRPS